MNTLLRLCTVVADQQSRKLVGMITDLDLCSSVIAEGVDPKTTQIDKLLTLAALTCRDSENIETCERLMQEHQVRRIRLWMLKTALSVSSLSPITAAPTQPPWRSSRAIPEA